MSEEERHGRRRHPPQPEQMEERRLLCPSRIATKLHPLLELLSSAMTCSTDPTTLCASSTTPRPTLSNKLSAISMQLVAKLKENSHTRKQLA